LGLFGFVLALFWSLVIGYWLLVSHCYTKTYVHFGVLEIGFVLHISATEDTVFLSTADCADLHGLFSDTDKHRLTQIDTDSNRGLRRFISK